MLNHELESNAVNDTPHICVSAWFDVYICPSANAILRILLSDFEQQKATLNRIHR